MDTQKAREILRKVRQIELRANQLVDDMAGHDQSVFNGRGMDFADERERTLVLMIDISASGHLGSTMQTKRELAAELGGVLAFSATRNNDRVGLILFSDQVELFIPPRTGHDHILRIIREILFFAPGSSGTDATRALDFCNRVLERRALTFLISDFCLPGSLEELRKKLRTTSRRHDLLAVSVKHPREFELPDVGIITLEDPATGALAEIDTSDPKLREAFADEAARRWEIMKLCLRGCGVDHLELNTDMPYLPCLINFLGNRRGRSAS